MGIGEIVGLCGGIIGILGTICAIITFMINRKKDNYKEGAEDSEIRGDIKYIRNFFDDLRLDVKEIARKQDQQNERITRLEESDKSAHKRIDRIDKILVDINK